MRAECMNDLNCRGPGAPSLPGKVCTWVGICRGRQGSGLGGVVGDLWQTFDPPAPPREVGRQGEGGDPRPNPQPHWGERNVPPRVQH